MKKEFISTAELAKLLGISRIAVYKKIKAGKIKAEKKGRNYFIDRQYLPEILDIALTSAKKEAITSAVKKTVEEYGQTLKLLGKE
ncbi:MAG: hypothetical protein A2359_00170 [Candidatus Moranbacteria bacterium RIFOXYB1_FULL_43_19]|nr:MAG: hypothetical protein A2359_00170 [Candidatus Moranbacteria bacterium RIFOXYB1_FULL_43_19]OGI34092.1 MAG: hypothetical protein A2420_00880 [Candidatus Moranbacteria bacterium RIFOXYC1_FULL_44_13]OGI37801.1 MAG: hypothetical protein A2612_04115 [Candidatus Moranbacteria bacterium RIFOXYD1_FULL_44_12]